MSVSSSSSKKSHYTTSDSSEPNTGSKSSSELSETTDEATEKEIDVAGANLTPEIDLSTKAKHLAMQVGTGLRHPTMGAQRLVAYAQERVQAYRDESAARDEQLGTFSDQLRHDLEETVDSCTILCTSIPERDHDATANACIALGNFALPVGVGATVGLGTAAGTAAALKTTGAIGYLTGSIAMGGVTGLGAGVFAAAVTRKVIETLIKNAPTSAGGVNN